MLDKLLPVKVGQRTELVALAIALLGVLNALGLVSSELFAKALDILGPIGLATLAAKLDRLLKPLGLSTTPVVVADSVTVTNASTPPPAPSPQS